jgi:hypothetical protein
VQSRCHSFPLQVPDELMAFKGRQVQELAPSAPELNKEPGAGGMRYNMGKGPKHEATR